MPLLPAGPDTAGVGDGKTAAHTATSHRHGGKRQPLSHLHRGAAAAATTATTATATSSSSATAAADRLVQQTNDDSVISKRSAVSQHYFDDPFLRYFVHKLARRSPLINRGYYLRMVVMTDVVTRSVCHLLKLQQQHQQQAAVAAATVTTATRSSDSSSGGGATTAGGAAAAAAAAGGAPPPAVAPPTVQVVSIGAGYDTLAFRLLHARSPWRLSDEAGVVRFYEIDFAAVMAAKASLMRAAPPDTFADEWLQQMPSPPPPPPAAEASGDGAATTSTSAAATAATTTSTSAATTTSATATPSPLCCSGACRYHAVGVDLRGDGAAASWLTRLRSTCPHFSLDVPTVVYAECVTQYLPPHDTAALLRAVAGAFTTAVWVSYDQMQPHDSFGALMCRALQQRGAPLLGIRACPSGRAATRRALRCGFACAVFANFFDLSRHHVCGAERARVDALEAFDEAEEWSEMCAHYGLTLAATQPQLTAGVLAAVPALQVVAPTCVPVAAQLSPCASQSPMHACASGSHTPASTSVLSPATATITTTTRTTSSSAAVDDDDDDEDDVDSGKSGSATAAATLCRVEQREWPSGGRFAFDGWGNGGAAAEVHESGDIVVITFGGFEVGRSHQRVNRVYCHSLRRGELTVVATLLPSSSSSSSQQGEQQAPGQQDEPQTREEAAQMPARIFHSFTRLGVCCYVVFGGRSNPSAASNTAYLLECDYDSMFATTASTSVVVATWRELRPVHATTRSAATTAAAAATTSAATGDADAADATPLPSPAASLSSFASTSSPPPVPEPRYRHTATALSARELFIFGGRSATGAFLGDAWRATVDVAAGTIAWQRVTLHGDDVPAALCSAAAVTLPACAMASDDRSDDVPPQPAAARAESSVVLMSGGLQYGERCTNALWWMDVRSGRCVRVVTTATPPSASAAAVTADAAAAAAVGATAVGARFSHTLTHVRVDGVDKVLVLGGCVCEARAAEDSKDDDDNDEDDKNSSDGRDSLGSGSGGVGCVDVRGEAKSVGCGGGGALRDGKGRLLSTMACACVHGSSGGNMARRNSDVGVRVPAAMLLDVAALRVYVAQHEQQQQQQQQEQEQEHEQPQEQPQKVCASAQPLVQALTLPRTCPSWARHACVSIGDGVVAVMGGGYACFSFGTFTAKPCLLCLGQRHALCDTTAAMSMSHDTNNNNSNNNKSNNNKSKAQPHDAVALPYTPAVLLSLPRPPVLELAYSADTFVRVATLAQRPVVFRRVPLGACVARWSSPAYLKAAEGDTVVSVHVAPAGAHLLDFVRKNFRFAHVRFRELVDHVTAATAAHKRRTRHGKDNNSHNNSSNNSHSHSSNSSNSSNKTEAASETWYYRSIAARMRSERADVWSDFCTLGGDFVLPPGAHEYIVPRLHQSCLRINAPPLQLWTHYDTRDNVLCQIVGRKRVVFFPPSAYNALYMTGSSSAVLDLDAPDVLQYPRFVDACKSATEVTLNAGDMVYFPAQWLHHVTTLADDDDDAHEGDKNSKNNSNSAGGGDNNGRTRAEVARRSGGDGDAGGAVTAPYSVSVNVFFDHFAPGEYDGKDLYGNKDPLACTALQQAIVSQTQQLVRGAQLTQTAAPLPPEYAEFALRQAIAQLERAADEMAAARRGECNAAFANKKMTS